MAIQTQPVEVNQFSGGLITDASPLTSPENTALDMENMALDQDGSVHRRLGMDLEEDYVAVTTGLTGTTNMAVSSFTWENAGGIAGKTLLVVQTANILKVFHTDTLPLSNNLIHTYTFATITDRNRKFSYSVVDGMLVVATGQKTPTTFRFTAPSTITVSTITLKVRDFFGVQDIDSVGADLYDGQNVQKRPTTLPDTHLYNLRNQTWAIPHVSDSDAETPTPEDTISMFVAFHQAIYAETRYPSNSDNVIEVLYANPENTSNRTVDRFNGEDLIKSPLGTTKAPQGYFIIDAMERGVSRLAEAAALVNIYPQIDVTPTVLPIDTTPGGPTALAQYAGRIFYGGFSGEVIGGDSLSPRMSSYILFTKVVDGPGDLGRCYQEGDPTSKNSPDIVDTDGGFIRINGAFGIQSLINLGDALVVVATNGVWRILGGSENGFTATSYIVEKLSDRGCSNPNTIVVAENTVMFWGDDGIYHISPDQFGSWVVNNISNGRIQKLFDAIPLEHKRIAVGSYDSFERKVRWLYYTVFTSTEQVKELVLDLSLTAFYVNRVMKLSGATFPKPVTMFTNPTDLGDNDDKREIGYVVITSVSPSVTYSFAKYRDNSFRDWFSLDGVGVDATALLVTSYMSGGDFQRNKQVPYIHVHMKRTETGYDEDMNPLNPSSAMMQAQWNWANSAASGKWGRVFQVYRYRREHLPYDETDTYDNGFFTVVSKNKLRGRGKVLSLLFTTEPDKDFHLYGWSMLLSIAGNV